MKLGKLHHGGVMTNYKCTAACRHCLYSSSPDRSGGYISRGKAVEICTLLKKGGCRSIHIGGGEPFLHFEGLVDILNIAKSASIAVEYIETNAYWATDTKSACKKLNRLLEAGADTLCISVDPFHVEYVPLDRVYTLIDACNQTGFGYFLWHQQYLNILSKSGLDTSVPWSRKELESILGRDYIWNTAQNYGITFGGRAQCIEKEYLELRSIESIIDSMICPSLLSTGHFHVDLYGNYIPPSCTGIVIPLSEASSEIDLDKYPVLRALLKGGVSALLDYAERKGFHPNSSGYTSKCSLCIDIRQWLCENSPTSELYSEHYYASTLYY